jgi:hypothetical protein
MPKTKADLEKELKAQLAGSKKLQSELHAALLKIEVLEKAAASSTSDDNLAKETAEMKSRLKRVIADKVMLTVKNEECVRLVNKAKSMCGMLPTKVESSAWGHIVSGHLGEEYLAEMKRFAES